MPTKYLLLSLFMFCTCFACSPKGQGTSTTSNKASIVEGDFQSVAGVKDPLSCFCSNGGYVTTTKGERVAVCFGENQSINCKKITVNGMYEQHTKSSDPTDVCANQSATFLKVKAFSCL